MDSRHQINCRPEGKVAVTQSLARALTMLELPQLDLSSFVSEEIDKNPLLEYIFSPSNLASLPNELAAKPSLHEFLMLQIQEDLDPRERHMALECLMHLDEKGFFTGNLADIANSAHLPISKAETIFLQLQAFDPPGIFARNLAETFLIQLARQGLETGLLFQIIHDAFDDLIHKRFKKIEKKFQISEQKLTMCIQKLSRLSTRPAADFHPNYAQPLYFDLKIEKISGKWTIAPIEDHIPKFRIRTEFFKIQPISSEEKQTISQFITSAKWLKRSLEKRRKILLTIGKYLVNKQKDFLDRRGPLLPLNAKELALECGVHESTVSRALAGKYAISPKGPMLLKSLVSSATNEPTKELIAKLILQEDKSKPLTDEEILKKLRASGHNIARRTVSKYRKKQKFGSALSRKCSR